MVVGTDDLRGPYVGWARAVGSSCIFAADRGTAGRLSTLYALEGAAAKRPRVACRAWGRGARRRGGNQLIISSPRMDHCGLSRRRRLISVDRRETAEALDCPATVADFPCGAMTFGLKI